MTGGVAASGARRGGGAVVFDVGRVLIQWDLRYLFARLIADPDELEWFVTTVVTPEWHFQHDMGQALEVMLPERIARFPDQRARIEAYATRFAETIPGPVPGMPALVRRLWADGIPLFAITNFGASFWPAFHAGWDLAPLFGDIVVSGVEKIGKPDPAIFDLAARRFGIDPAASLFIDDNADNIAAAAARGWGTHQFRDAAHCEAALADAGWLTIAA